MSKAKGSNQGHEAAGPNVYTLRKPIIFEGEEIKAVTVGELLGADMVAVEDELMARVEASGGTLRAGDLKKSYFMAARAIGRPYEVMLKMCAADCTYLVGMVNKAGGF